MDFVEITKIALLVIIYIGMEIADLIDKFEKQK